MSDQEFVIRFRTEIEQALRDFRQLLSMVQETERAIARVASATQGMAATGGMAKLTRAAEQNAAIFAQFGINASTLDQRLQRLGPNFANSFERAIRRLPIVMGDMALMRNANQVIPTSKFAEAIRIFRMLETVFQGNQREAAKFARQANVLGDELIRLKRPMIDSLMQQADQARAGGGLKSIALQISSLRSAERLLVDIQKAGVNVSAELTTVRQRLIDLGTPKVVGRIATEIQGMLPNLKRFRENFKIALQQDDMPAALRNLKAMERAILALEQRGATGRAGLGQLLQGTRQAMADVTLEIERRTAAQARLNATERLNAKAQKAREDLALGLGSGDTKAQIAALTRLEDVLRRLQLRGHAVSGELVRVTHDLNNLRGAAANAKEVDRLLKAVERNNQRISERALEGKGPSRILETRGLQLNLELVARGHYAASAAATKHRNALAALGPAHSAEVQALLRERDVLLQSIRARELVGLKPTAQQLGRGLIVNQELANKATGNLARDAAVDMAKFSTAIDANRGRLALWDSAFGHHARRIAEGLIIYNAFGAALGGLQQSFLQVANLDREFARFEAVAGNLSDADASKFIEELGQTAVDTLTPLNTLVSTLDLVAASFTDIQDAGERSEAVNAFQRLAGEFSNVMDQAGNQEEVTRQLVALFRQTRIEGQGSGQALERFRAFLDLIVTAGGNASSIISQVTEGLREVGPAAKASGADMGLLAFTIAEVVKETGESGLSIGNTLKTVLANLTAGSKVKDVFSSISESVVQVTDQNGRLLRSTEILTNLFDAVENGSLSIGQAQEVFRDLGPAIQPGQVGIVNEIFNAIGRGLERVKSEAPEASGALDALNSVIVDTLGGRLEQVMIRFETLISTKMVDPIRDAGGIIIDVLNGIAAILENDFFRTLVITVGQFAIFVGGAALMINVLKRFGLAILGIKTTLSVMGNHILTSAAAMKGLGTATGTTAANGAAQMTLFGNAVAGVGVKARLTTIAIAGIGAAARTVLPILLAMAAIDFATSTVGLLGLNSALDEITNNRQNSLGTVGFRGGERPIEDLLIRRTSGSLTDIFDTRESQIQDENLGLLLEKFEQLVGAHNLTRQKAKALIDVVTDENNVIKTTAVTADELDEALFGLSDTQDGLTNAFDDGNFSVEEYIGSLLNGTDKVDELTAAEKRAQEALRITNELSDARAAALQRLTDQLASGAITLDEFAEGEGNIQAASEATANFLSAFADQLSLIPGLQERIAATGQSAGDALMGMLLDSPQTIDQMINIINRMVELAEANETVSTSLEQNPVGIHINSEGLVEGVTVVQRTFEWLTTGTFAVKSFLANNPVEPRIALEALQAQAAAALRILLALRQAASATDAAFDSANPEVRTARNIMQQRTADRVLELSKAIADLIAAMNGADGVTSQNSQELQALRESLAALQGISPDDPRLGGAGGGPSQTGILDIGDLPASAISQIVAMARAAQARVVAAGGTVDDDETVAIFRNALFQQLISGVDQRFLVQAIEELTEVERKRLELEQQRLQDVTRSLVTQVGPIQSLVSAPVLMAGGGVLSGQGVNADPRFGNFTINVPINWSGMNLQQLQKFIYDTIAKAWIDAGRGG